MMEKDKIEQFMVYGIENKVSSKELFTNEMLILFFTLILIFVTGKSFFTILILLPALFYPISCIVIKKGKIIEGASFFLHGGIFSACISFLWAVAGMAMLFSLFTGRERIAAISIALIGYVVSLFLCVLIIKRAIAKTTDNKLNKMLGGIPVALFGAFGMYLGRTFLKDLDQDTAAEIFCSLCFLISYLCLLGIMSILKYRYIIKHPEIMDKRTSK